MKTRPGRSRRAFAWLGLVLLSLIALNTRAGYAERQAAPSAGVYEIAWSTVDGGGVVNASGGAYTLNATIGQYDAGARSSGAYGLNGGFWFELFGTRLYLPMLLR